MDGGNVNFLRNSDGEFAKLTITELSGTGNFLLNTLSQTVKATSSLSNRAQASLVLPWLTPVRRYQTTLT
jgi:hypothetical protein